MRHHPDQPVPHLLVNPRLHTIELSQGEVQLLASLCMDEVVQAFSLHQVELPVVERPPRELSRQGLSEPLELAEALQKLFTTGVASMDLELEHVFPGEGVGLVEVEQQPLVDLSVGLVIVETFVVGVSRLQRGL